MVAVCVMTALNYPSHEGGFTVDTDDVVSLVSELSDEYAFVEACYDSKDGWYINAYEHFEV